MTDNAEEVAELKKKIAESKRRTAEINQRITNLKKAEAALMKFHASGPRKKKKSGRPSFWKSPQGLFFVIEVESFKKNHKCKKTAFAIREVRKKTIQRARRLKARGIKSPDIATAERLQRLKIDAALQSRYQEARKFWLFMIDQEAYRQKEATLQYNCEQALAALEEQPTRNSYNYNAYNNYNPYNYNPRNPYDFSRNEIWPPPR
jgi:hypothetical protein